MSSHRSLEVFANKAELIAGIDRQFEAVVSELLQLQPLVHVVLTGGTVGIAMLEPIDAGHKLDWSRIHLWWGDERFVDAASPDRNEGQAQRALIHRLPIPAHNVHRMPEADAGLSLDEATEAYAQELGNFGEGNTAPAFDITLLGIGPDAHVASLFPDHVGLTTPTTSAAIAVRNSPKPPPERISLSLHTINGSKRVWVIASGDDKAEAVHAAFTSEQHDQVPASAVHGTVETIFFTDAAAAAQLSK